LDHEAALTPAEPITPPQSSALRKTFMGKDGLRAGWSLLIFIAIFAAIVFLVNVIGHRLFPPAAKSAKIASDTSTTPRSLFVPESVGFVATVLATWIMSKIERRPNSVYGFGGDRKLGNFLAGLAWGVMCISLLVVTLCKAGLLVIESRLLFGGEVFRYGAIWLVGFLLVALFEEYSTRGYLQYTLTRGLSGAYQWLFKTGHSDALGFWTAAAIFSILFGLGHSKNPGESPLGLLSAGLASMVFCLSLWRTGSLWWAIGFHTTWDWGESFLYGVADSGTMVEHHLLATHPVGEPILSGGTTGPEGSIFVVAVLFLVCIIITLTLPRRRASENHAAVLTTQG
jgi:membrane protease YdiL (CAAX protease family)